METTRTPVTIHEYQLVFTKEQRKREVISPYFGIGRHVIGRISNCDIQIKSKKVSAIHAVLEITETSVKIYDMNSTNGVEVNGKRIIVGELKKGDLVSIAGLEYRVNERVTEKLELPESEPVFTKKKNVTHPILTSDDIEFGEYIFEDTDEIYPIFDYNLASRSAEVIILFEDNIFSIDYVDLSNPEIYLEGREQKSEFKNIFFPYLKKKEKVHLLTNVGDKTHLHLIQGFQTEKLTSNGILKVHEGIIQLEKDDIIHIHKESLEIYVRQAKSPPVVATPPILRQDAFFHKYVIPTVLAIFIPLLIISFLSLDLEEDKEVKIERIATILYNKKILGNKPAETPKNIKSVVSTSQEKNDANLKGDLGKGDKIKVAEKVEKTTVEKTTKATVTNKTSKKQTKSSKIVAVKSLDFSSSLNQLLVSQKRLDQASNSGEVDTEEFDENLELEVGGSPKLKRIGIDQGESLSEGLGDRIASNIGAEGLSDKKSYFTMGLAGNAVVKGSVDGNDVWEKLRSHQSQFRFCVEKSSKPGENVSARARFKFIIGASGYVSRGNIISRHNNDIKKCMVDVLKGIAFTPPIGGGVAEINLPWNFKL